MTLSSLDALYLRNRMTIALRFDQRLSHNVLDAALRWTVDNRFPEAGSCVTIDAEGRPTFSRDVKSGELLFNGVTCVEGKRDVIGDEDWWEEANDGGFHVVGISPPGTALPAEGLGPLLSVVMVIYPSMNHTVLSVRWNHALGDLVAIEALIRAWAERCATTSKIEDLAVDAASYSTTTERRERLDEIPHSNHQGREDDKFKGTFFYEYNKGERIRAAGIWKSLESSVSSNGERFVDFRLVLGTERLKELKNAAWSSGYLARYPTTNDVVCALFWKIGASTAMRKTLAAGDDEDEVEGQFPLHFFVDARRRVPELNNYIFGNATSKVVVGRELRRHEVRNARFAEMVAVVQRVAVCLRESDDIARRCLVSVSSLARDEKGRVSVEEATSLEVYGAASDAALITNWSQHLDVSRFDFVGNGSTPTDVTSGSALIVPFVGFVLRNLGSEGGVRLAMKVTERFKREWETSGGRLVRFDF